MGANFSFMRADLKLHGGIQATLILGECDRTRHRAIGNAKSHFPPPSFPLAHRPSTNQVRDEYRKEYDAGRGGWGAQDFESYEREQESRLAKQTETYNSSGAAQIPTGAREDYYTASSGRDGGAPSSFPSYRSKRRDREDEEEEFNEGAGGHGGRNPRFRPDNDDE
ncbi:hypothetical protein BC830DRAFT_1169792 [Chytriomyces sp. MP71]|nr:hypothetical protein BC830DRAFT_1169792 [Chytriomyces sp. MP71]